jgi:hypothetical protein
MKIVMSLVIVMAAALPIGAAGTSCTGCHQDVAAKFAADLHREIGLSCHDCHGGNPDPKADLEMAKDASFRGAPQRSDLPDFCGRCHASAEFMKRFNPAARVDQVAEYRTSVHGRLLATGDANVATCIDCHSVHDIRRRTDPDAPVYATKVAETCSRCHSDAKKMAGYGIPTDQHERWKISVHANAMFVKNDLTAPTCNDCHGNHGATPPGVASVSFVCGNCHGREAELFRASTKQKGWEQHNELLASASGCGDCHDDRRKDVAITHFGECVTCHENHAVVRPSVAMIGELPDIPCAFCHEGRGALASLIAEPTAKASNYRATRDRLLEAAQRAGVTEKDRFDWFVDQAQGLPFHRMPAAADGKPAPLRPEFARLFEKFRIGRTHYAFKDSTGRTVKVAVRSCGDCHVDTRAAVKLAAATHGLTSMIARAERIQLAAHRGGVETRDARVFLDGAIDNQIELETLVHAFDEPVVKKKEEEGLKNARSALLTAQRSLEELTYRRKGLFIALGIIVLTLIALAMKIRTL